PVARQQEVVREQRPVARGQVALPLGVRRRGAPRRSREGEERSQEQQGQNGKDAQAHGTNAYRAAHARWGPSTFSGHRLCFSHHPTRRGKAFGRQGQAMRSFLVGLLVAGALLAGCFSQDGTESTAPSPVGVPTPAPGAPDTPLGGAGTGCTGNHSV